MSKINVRDRVKFNRAVLKRDDRDDARTRKARGTVVDIKKHRDIYYLQIKWDDSLSCDKPTWIADRRLVLEEDNALD